MGMPIAVQSHHLIGDVAVFDTDRSVTGQDGAGFDSAAAAAADSFPGRLAERLFEIDGAVEHVWVASSQVVVRRRGGWDEAAARSVAEVITRFFVHYPS